MKIWGHAFLVLFSGGSGGLGRVRKKKEGRDKREKVFKLGPNLLHFLVNVMLIYSFYYILGCL